MSDLEDAVPQAERRRYLRIPLEVAVKCHLIHAGRPEDALDCQTVDLSNGGLALKSERSLQTGETLVVSFSLPEDATQETDRGPADPFVGRKPRLVAMRGRVVWCEQCEGQDYRLGVEFLTVNGHAHRPLIDFLKDEEEA
jgi:c-di-GMP-binding flagellar brake protein YcgR